MSGNIITEAEDKLGLNATQCPALLGVSKGNWSSWKNGRLPVPDYVQCSIQAHLALSKRALRTLMQARGISAG